MTKCDLYVDNSKRRNSFRMGKIIIPIIDISKKKNHVFFLNS